ncbi:MAG: family 16 glycosylhydrolase [Prevotellaceae bacterium]|jgi:hypothetical protein|nr:family 16 glycosylhydrolase [Prevotellaceae bacterium]
MAGFFKRLIFHLSGGVTSTSKYEARRAALEEKFVRYVTLKQSPALLRYKELTLQVATPRRQSGLSAKEWKAMKREMARLQKSADVMAFFKLQKRSKRFREFACWQLTFEDIFDGDTLNQAKWVTRKALLNAAVSFLYSPSDENHVYTNGGNVSVADKTLKIVVKREQAGGIGFHEQMGFMPIERKYTSGIVSTACSHAQLYGRVEAKIRFCGREKGIYHSMWLSAGKMLPHVNVLRIGDKIEFSAFAEAGNGEKLQHVEAWKRSLLKQNAAYVVAIEWSRDVVVWKINGVTMFSAPNIVNEPMYIAFSSGVTGKPNIVAPAALEVCWVRCYERRNDAAES